MRTWRNMAFDLLDQACYDFKTKRIYHEGIGFYEEACNTFAELGWLKPEEDGGYSCPDWGPIREDGE